MTNHHESEVIAYDVIAISDKKCPATSGGTFLGGLGKSWRQHNWPQRPHKIPHPTWLDMTLDPLKYFADWFVV